jgi:hypothetical protein
MSPKGFLFVTVVALASLAILPTANGKRRRAMPHPRALTQDRREARRRRTTESSRRGLSKAERKYASVRFGEKGKKKYWKESSPVLKWRPFLCRIKCAEREEKDEETEYARVAPERRRGARDEREEKEWRG